MGVEEASANDDIQVWLDEAKRSSASEFAARRRGLYFLLQEPSADAGQIEFETVMLESKPASSSRSRNGGLRVAPLAKSPRSPYQDRISVGRARNCDIVVRHSSVSKLHAHLRTREDGVFTITDLGSHNGTRVNDKPVSPNTPTPLRSEDVVLLGAVTARVLDGAALHAMLMRLHGVISLWNAGGK